MRVFSSINISTATISVIAIALLVQSCRADVDGTLGYSTIPESEQMTMRHLTIKGGESLVYDAESSTEDSLVYRHTGGKFFRTSMYRTDSIPSQNQGVGLIGVERNDTFGIRRASFASSMIFGNSLEEDGFGYKPIFDTLKIFFTVDDHAVDTLTPVRYNVYELKAPLLGTVINAEDTTAYLNCDMSKVYDKDKKLFTFIYPDSSEDITPTNPAIFLNPVDMSADGATAKFIRKLMLIPDNYLSSEWDGYARDSLGVYEDESLWLAYFHGLYIEPDTTSVYENYRGSLYEVDLTGSGLYLTGRNRNPQDPTQVQDTVGMYYYFEDMTVDYNMAAIHVDHDYSKGLRNDVPALLSKYRMDGYDATGKKLPCTERTETNECFVEGIGGPAMELYFTDDFIDTMKEVVSTVDEEGGMEYRAIGVNSCYLRIYVKGGLYVWEDNQSNMEAIIPLLNSSIARFGMYVNMNNLIGILDYDYEYESSASTTLDYGGNLNRARCCYEMNISAYIQSLLRYLISLRNDDGTFEEFDETVQTRSIFVAPAALTSYTMLRSVVQGGEGNTESPIHLEMTYTLIH